MNDRSVRGALLCVFQLGLTWTDTRHIDMLWLIRSGRILNATKYPRSEAGSSQDDDLNCAIFAASSIIYEVYFADFNLC